MEIQVTRTVKLHEHSCKSCNIVFASEEFNGTVSCPKCRSTVRRKSTVHAIGTVRSATPLDDADRPIIGKKLLAIRKSRGWSQAHVAELIRGYASNGETITDPYISTIERGSAKQPPQHVVALVTDWINITYADIFGTNVATV